MADPPEPDAIAAAFVWYCASSLCRFFGGSIGGVTLGGTVGFPVGVASVESPLLPVCCLCGRCSERYWFSVAAQSGCWLFLIELLPPPPPPPPALVGMSGSGWLMIDTFERVVAVDAIDGGGLANAEPAPVS